MDALQIVGMFREVARAVRAQIAHVDNWGLSGQRDGQYTIDVTADDVALTMLADAGFAVLSEESGVAPQAPGTPDTDGVLVVVDPIDGSTNASAGLPWYATSLCAVDADGPLASLVVNQATGTEWYATRGGGAFRDGQPISVSDVETMSDAFVSVSGLPTHHFGWRQFRCYGAAALDICSVADGTFDAFADLSVDAHGGWDYLGALLICREAGGLVVDAHDRELIVRTHQARRTPVAAATAELLAELLAENAIDGDDRANDDQLSRTDEVNRTDDERADPSRKSHYSGPGHFENRWRLNMRKVFVALVVVVLASLSLAGTAQAQDDTVFGTVTADPATVPAAGEYTMTATGADFIPNTAILLVKCVSPSDTLVPGQSDLEEITAAATAINALQDCDVASAQNVEVDGDGAWSAELTADVGDNFFLSAGALDGSQAGATWVAIVPEGADQDAEGSDDGGDAAEEEADEADANLADTGVETGLLAVIGSAVLGAGVLAVREGRRFRS